MSRFSKPLTLAQLEDVTLGVFAFVPSSETLAHLIRYLSTSAGNELSDYRLRCALGMLTDETVTWQQILHGKSRFQLVCTGRESSPVRRDLQIIQYSLKLIVPFMHWRARIQHSAGLRAAPTSSVAVKLAKFGSILGDYRMLSNIWGTSTIVSLGCSPLGHVRESL